MRGNIVRSVTTSFFIGASSNLQITRTSIKARTSSILGQIGQFTLDLLALERLKIFPYTYNGENVVRMIATSLLIGSSSILQVTRTTINSWMSSNSGQIGLSTSELLSLEWQKKPIFDLVQSIVPSILIGSSSNLQVTGAAINSRTRSNFDGIRLFISELFALESQKSP